MWHHTRTTLRKDYPERMTIVLQHQFENLVVTDDYFAVTLWFKNKEATSKNTLRCGHKFC